MSDKKMASEEDILKAIKAILARSGYMNKLQAEVRANITQALLKRHPAMSTQPPTLAEEGVLVNELVREYLEWNGYLYTSSVMVAEAALNTEKKSRQDLCEAIGVKDDDNSLTLPLLTNIVAAYTERIKRKINRIKTYNNGFAKELNKLNKDTEKIE